MAENRKTSAAALTKLFADCQWLKDNLEPLYNKVKAGTATEEEVETYITKLAEYISGYKDYSGGLVSDMYSGNPIVNLAKTGMVMVDNLEKTFGFDLGSIKQFLAKGSIDAKKKQNKDDTGDSTSVEEPKKDFGSLPNPFALLSQFANMASQGQAKQQQENVGGSILNLIMQAMSQGKK
jgi:hypothetical protein